MKNGIVFENKNAYAKKKRKIPDKVLHNKAVLLQIGTRALNLNLAYSNVYW